ncbi:LPS-assembly protein LptD [Pelistega ratti]|uniref:LPS-assembly protein LptD n=1 Tax=Pelistega ratti TaxID=2652177 RepID=UPI001FAA8737|nr:LPS-assembly protein LptD [Pelistega ratti]
MQKIVGLTFLLLMPVVNAQSNTGETQGLDSRDLPRLQESTLLTLENTDKNDVMTFTDSSDIDVTNDNNRIKLSGKAQIRRADLILKGDSITYDRLTGEVQAEGNTRLFRDGSLITGPRLKYNVDQKTGLLSSPVYRLTNGGSGQASSAELIDDNHMQLKEAIYSACNCDKKAWYISANKVDLYNDENEGIAENGALYIGGVPVLWSPYFTFPIKREKKTGWLMPTFSSTSRSGFGLSLPYFVNLVPNYDLTLTPQWYSKRGAMLGAEFRYIMPSYQGIVAGNYMPKDRKHDDKRWSLDWQHRQRLGRLLGWNIGLNIDIHGVSDNDYYRDFTTIALNQADETYLAKSASLTFSGYKYWSGYLMWKKYQSLHDLTSNDPRDYRYYYQYEREPELMIRGIRYDWNGFDVSTQNTWTRFRYPIHRSRVRANGTIVGGDGRQRWDGDRLVSYTQISYPIIRSGWYVTPKVGLHASHYRTDWFHFPSQAGTQYKSLSRVLPIFSVDSGMTFERETTLFGKPRVQTLEPRLYYVYIPYRDQSDIPIYDTTLGEFNFGTAFSENRYMGGWDRINDIHALTAGLTSRWYDEESGRERMALQVAQRFYIKQSEVSLPSERMSEQSRSEFLANGKVLLTDTFTTEAGVQVDTYGKKIAQTYATIRWFPKRLTSLSLTYRYQRDPFINETNNSVYPYQVKGKNNVSVAGQWPLSQRLYMVGRHDYSLKENRSTQSIIGLEYKGRCCWTSRVVFQRYAVSQEKTNTALYFQLELTGLGPVGSDPMETLRTSIPGYQNVKDPETDQSPFERYE